MEEQMITVKIRPFFTTSKAYLEEERTEELQIVLVGVSPSGKKAFHCMRPKLLGNKLSTLSSPNFPAAPMRGRGMEITHCRHKIGWTLQ